MSAMHVRVRAGGEHYALPVAGVREIARLGAVMPVPGAPPEVMGVWNLRGDVMAVLDLARLLGLEGGEPPSRIVVAEAGELRAGLAVESVTDVGSMPLTLEPADSPYLSATALIEGAPVGVVDLSSALKAASSNGAR
jgi:purine-binding chemotaxis protein CheW